MAARQYECVVKSLVWMTRDVFSLVFEPARPFRFAPGQFVSVVLPQAEGVTHERGMRRMYSLATADRQAGYELCVHQIAGGRGTTYLAGLRPGDRFQIVAPFGDFIYDSPGTRNVCFIATGTGISPIKAMATSEQFRKDPPNAAALLFGARSERDILYPGFFENFDVEVVRCLTRPSQAWKGFRGRVTDYLGALPETWPWQDTDFYLCGNGRMIEEVRQHLLMARGVDAKAVRQEAFFAPSTRALPFPKPEVQGDRKRAA